MSVDVDGQGALLEAQARVLEMIVRGAPLPDVLAALCTIVEHQAGAPVRAAILLLDRDGRHLRTGAGPSLPAAYHAAVDGIAISPDVGTCAAAAALRAIVITPDIANDRRWAALRDLPLSQGLCAAWSMPILGSDGTVLGTFGTYFLEPREPRARERFLVEVLARTAALAIERQRADQHLREGARRARFLSELDAATQQVDEAAQVMEVAARRLAEHLGVDRCAYAEIEDERVFVITGDHARGVPSIVGRWDVAAFGPACVQAMLAGEPYVVTDCEADDRISGADLEAYRATTMRAVVCVPLHRHGRFTAAMAVHQRVPRLWTDHERELIALVVARCWEALERTRVTRNLRESEAKHRAMVEASPESVTLVDCEGRLLQINAAGLRMIDAADEQEVLGRSIYDVVAPEDRERLRCFTKDVCGGRRGSLAFELIGRAGVRRAVESTAVALPAPTGGFLVLAITRDVTARVHAEQRLARVAEAALTIHSSGTLERVLQVVTEDARRIIGAHLAVASLTIAGSWAQAISAVSVSAKHRAFADHEARPTGAGIYAEVCRTNRPMRLTQPELEAHPAWRHFSEGGDRHPPLRGWLAVPFVGRDGANLGLVQLSDKDDGDFTEADEAILVQLAQLAAVAIENARLYEQLRDQDRRKDEFIATLAHELRNPLAPIRTGLHLLQLGVGADQAAKAQAMMERQLGHLVHLVDDLLDISRVSSGKITLKKQRVDFREVLDSALETTRPLVEASGNELCVELPAAPLPLEGDPTRMSQVIANLVNNAAKYTPAGGRIRIHAGAHEGMLRIRIVDTGVGIPADMLPRVFEMFTQVGRTIDRAQGGLGIGLTLSRRLIEMHGGTIEAASVGPNRGSTFTVCVPLDDVDLIADAPVEAARATPRRMRVLVVDDNVDGAETLAMMLELAGNEIRVAHTGTAALAAAISFDPDVVLLDIGLPELDGYEVARRLRAQATERRPFLVAVTGWGSEEDRRRAHAAGFDHHLVKPVANDTLADVLAAVAR